MGLFSNTRQEEEAEAQSPAETQTSTNTIEEHTDFSVTSPLELQLREKQRQLDGLKSRVTVLNNALDQMGLLISESTKSVGLVSSFIDQSKLDAESEKRLKGENAKLSTDNIEKSHAIKRLTAQLEKRDTEIEVLKSRANENRVTLEKARSSIILYRDKQAELTEALEVKNIELLNLNSKVADLTDQNDDLIRRLDAFEDQNTSLQMDIDQLTKRESELQQSLAESNALHDEEIKRNKSLASDLESTNRQLSETTSALIETKAEYDELSDELEYVKNSSEEQQRKYDNRVFGLKTEIDNLSSERRIIRQSLSELQEENASLKKNNRDIMVHQRELENQLRSMQKLQDKERRQLSEANAKLGDLSLRYNSALADSNHEQRQREKLEHSVEMLSEEVAKLREYRSKYEAILVQVTDLKGLVSDYQELVGKDRLTAMREPLTAHLPKIEDEPRGPEINPDNVINIKPSS